MEMENNEYHNNLSSNFEINKKKKYEMTFTFDGKVDLQKSKVFEKQVVDPAEDSLSEMNQNIIIPTSVKIQKTF